MGIRVNFSDTEGGDFEVIPVGTYLAKVTDGEIRESGPTSKNPGSQYINWELTIQEEGKYQGRKLFNNTSLLPHALFGLKGLLAATGRFTSEQLEATDLDFEIDDVIGSDVKVVVNHQEYDGEQRANVKRIKPAGTSSDAPESSILP